MTSFEQWLGRSVDGVLAYIGAVSWADFTGSAYWATNQFWNQLDRPIYWSVPLIVQGATLEQAATGTYNDYYKQVAGQLAAYRPGDSKIYVRTGWEFNGNWFPWSAQGKEQAFIDSFHQFVDTFRSVSDRFVFEWNVNQSDGYSQTMNPATAYPGDDYVDIIGMDFYYDPKWDSADPMVAWNNMVNERYGLQWLENFAATHNKPTAYSEWGVTTDNMAPYVAQAKAWFDSHNVVYQTYWNTDDAYPGKLSDNSDPKTGSAYISSFSGSSSPPAPVPDPVVAGVTLNGGAASDTLNGLAGNDTINGAGGNDNINGKGGNDVLTGGTGSDAFFFDTKPGTGNIDKITDFNPSYDSIRLEKDIFTALGALGKMKPGSFWAGAAAHDADDRIIYNKATGALLYDADGTGGGAAVQFATVATNLKLAASNFIVI